MIFFTIFFLFQKTKMADTCDVDTAMATSDGAMATSAGAMATSAGGISQATMEIAGVIIEIIRDIVVTVLSGLIFKTSKKC